MVRCTNARNEVCAPGPGQAGKMPGADAPGSQKPFQRTGADLTTASRNLTTADRVVEIARSWIGTPYHHQAAVGGVGCDCLGLVRGVYAELYGAPAEEPPAYSRDLAEVTGVETLIEAAQQYLVPIDFTEAGAVLTGDVVIFRLRAGAMAKHCAILTGAGRIIHAFEGGPVCEVNLSEWWQRRIAAVFRFPEKTWA